MPACMHMAKTTKSSGFDPANTRVIAFYLALLVVVAIIAYFLYYFVTEPVVRFQDYGYDLALVVQPTNYTETVQMEAKGKGAAAQIGLPANVALEEAEATMVTVMQSIYQRHKDVDVIVVEAYYEHNFGQAKYFALGDAVWGPEGRAAPVVHQRSKDNYQVRFRWTTKLPTVDERARLQKQLEQPIYVDPKKGS
jgi:hypothetical protein